MSCTFLDTLSAALKKWVGGGQNDFVGAPIECDEVVQVERCRHLSECDGTLKAVKWNDQPILPPSFEPKVRHLPLMY